MTSRSGASPPGKEKQERPRFFDSIAKNRCWAKADTVPGRHPDRWRKDAAGNIVCKRFGNCRGCLCFEYDHIVPYSKGDKELDIIEMAVYGDVIRPGNQCRCQTVAEVLGTYKSKDRLAACKLPYGEDSLRQ